MLTFSYLQPLVFRVPHGSKRAQDDGASWPLAAVCAVLSYVARHAVGKEKKIEIWTKRQCNSKKIPRCAVVLRGEQSGSGPEFSFAIAGHLRPCWDSQKSFVSLSSSAWSSWKAWALLPWDAHGSVLRMQFSNNFYQCSMKLYFSNLPYSRDCIS